MNRYEARGDESLAFPRYSLNGADDSASSHSKEETTKHETRKEALKNDMEINFL